MAPRLVVFDLDGTLLGADLRVSDATVRALEQARAAGLTLLAASGRSHWAAELVLKHTDTIDHVVCSNGAVLYRRSVQPKILKSHAMEAELVSRLYKSVAASTLADVCWAWETEAGIVPDPGFAELNREFKLDELRASPPLTLPGDADDPIAQRLAGFGDVFRLLVAHPELPRGELSKRLDGHLQEENLAIASSSAVFLEITGPGIDKETGLRDYCAANLFAASEVVAFGDHLNDLSMLQWAGRGIAMANSDPRVLAAIPEHTEATNDDDGVARELLRIVAEVPAERRGSVPAEHLDAPVRT
jgi:Cof subfamily protein (haloacid dehalogenase superfamily)